MLKIRNALTASPLPTIKDFKDNKLINGFKPSPDRGFSADACRLWEKYFGFLFEKSEFGINLQKKLEEFTDAKDEKHPLKKLHRFLKENDDKVNNENLLKLLLVRPDDPDIGFYLDKIPKKLSKECKKRIEKIFDYGSATKTESFKEFVYLLGVSVCPYCGRAFTTTAEINRGKFYRTNQIDHFIPKAQFPHLALSIWNLIPVCASCNHTKRDRSYKDLPYPYAEGMGDLYRFNLGVTRSLDYMISFKTGVGWEPKLVEYRIGDDSEDELLRKLKSEAEMLHIEELYSSHADYVQDICLQRMIFNDAYIDEIYEKFRVHFNSKADVRRLLYMKSIDSEKIGSSPLDKLARDIDMQIDDLIKKSREDWF